MSDSRALSAPEQRARLLLRVLDTLTELGLGGVHSYKDKHYQGREELLCLLVSVQTVIRNMSPLENRAVTLVCFLGHNEESAARAMGVSRGALQAYLRAAYRKVAKIFETDHQRPPLNGM